MVTLSEVVAWARFPVGMNSLSLAALDAPRKAPEPPFCSGSRQAGLSINGRHQRRSIGAIHDSQLNSGIKKVPA